MTKRSAITIWMVFFSFMVLAVNGCAGAKKDALHVADGAENGELVKNVTDFYDYILDKKLTNYHNTLDFEKHFLTRQEFYDFLDTFFPLMRDRNILRSSFQTYSIQGVEVEESGNTAIVNVSFYSKDVVFLKRKLKVRHKWEKVYGKWYPHGVTGKKLKRYERPFKLYTVWGV